MKDADISKILIEQDASYKKLYEEHKKLEDILQKIDKNKYLTSAEEIERKKIQKQKLFLKDSMAELIREYRQKVRNEN